MFGLADCVRLLLESGVDVHATDGDGMTALLSACMSPHALKCYGDGGRAEVVRLLLEKGADPNCGLSNGASAMGLAAVNGHIECLRVLLEKGGDPDTFTILAAADAEKLSREEIISMFLDGAGCRALLAKYGTRLTGAAKAPSDSITSQLLERKVQSESAKVNKSSSGPALEEQAAVGYRVPIQFEQALDAAKRKNIDDERRIKELLLEIGGLNKKLADMEMA